MVAVAVAALLGITMAGSAAADCPEVFDGQTETYTLRLAPDGETTIGPVPENAERVTEVVCQWNTTRRIQVHPDCNIRGITVNGAGIRPAEIDVERVVDGETALSRTPTGGGGGWTLQYNGSMLCSDEECRQSRYHVRTSNPAPMAVCLQTVTMYLRLF
jgi:hypothetical protein